MRYIHTGEIFGDPDVNILNDNVIQSVGYRVKDTNFEFRTVYSNTVPIYVVPAPTGTTTIDGVLYSTYSIDTLNVKRDNTTDRSNFTLIQTSIGGVKTKTAGWDSVNNVEAKYSWSYDFISFDIDFGESVVDLNKFSLSASMPSSLIQYSTSSPSELIQSNVSSDFVFEGENFVVNSYQEVINSMFNLYNGNISSVKDNDSDFDKLFINIRLVKKSESSYTVYCVYKTMMRKTLSFIVYSLLTPFQLDFKVSVITNNYTDDETDNDFELSSNELMQDNATLSGELIYEKIAENIVANYNKGKATISMTVAYDGTNEYLIGEEVVPMRDAENPLLVREDNSDMSFIITSNEITYDGIGTQRLEMVEKVILPPPPTYNISAPIDSNTDYQTSVYVKNLTTGINTYLSGKTIQVEEGTILQVNVTSGGSVNWINVNGVQIGTTNGATFRVTGDSVITYQWTGIVDYHDLTHDVWGYPFQVNSTTAQRYYLPTTAVGNVSVVIFDEAPDNWNTYTSGGSPDFSNVSSTVQVGNLRISIDNETVSFDIQMTNTYCYLSSISESTIGKWVGVIYAHSVTQTVQ